MRLTDGFRRTLAGCLQAVSGAYRWQLSAENSAATSGISDQTFLKLKLVSHLLVDYGFFKEEGVAASPRSIGASRGSFV